MLNKEIAVTGRVKSWLDNPQSKLPVSCTTFRVEDSMEGKDGIEASWIFTSYGLRNAAGVALDLSKLRAKGVNNGRGLVSSGVVSFSKFYSLLNQELRRGGQYKNGAITLFLNYDHPDCLEFLMTPLRDLPWVKRAIYIDDDVASHSILPILASKVNEGAVWLAKKQYDKKGNRLFSNVCLEILLKHRATCLLSHINLGMVREFRDLPKVFAEGMRFLCELHPKTQIGEDNCQYLLPKDDKQVGLGVIGLSNLLAINKIRYVDFVADLELALENKADSNSLASWLVRAYQEAARIAQHHGMERAFTIAPTASTSYRYTDYLGFSTTPEISPPISREIDRDSETLGLESFEYHPSCEVAIEVGWDTQWRLLNAWQRLMDITGFAHSISANIWNTQLIDADWIVNQFIPSSLKTTYYRLEIDSRNLDKTQFIELTPDTKITCNLNPINDEQYCESCGG